MGHAMMGRAPRLFCNTSWWRFQQQQQQQLPRVGRHELAVRSEYGRDTATRVSRPPGVRLAVGETIILLHPPLPLVGVSIWMERGCQ